MNALVIDDSRATRCIMGRILRQIGFEVVEADNGRAGLDRLRGMARPEVALVDWNMPEMSGFDFVRAVRADSAFAATRLVMVTTETELLQVAAALEQGADEYIMKPFTAEMIVQKLDLLGVPHR